VVCGSGCWGCGDAGSEAGDDSRSGQACSDTGGFGSGYAGYDSGG
jgi:hypothetical protein